SAAFKGARETAFSTSVAGPPAKPNLSHIALPVSAVQLSSSADRLNPGGSASLSLAVTIPEGAQDGVYKTVLALETRLGKRTLPVSFRVVSPISLPPFHISPTAVVLRVVDKSAPEPQLITISSHLDAELPLRVYLKSGEGYTRPCAELLRARNA